MSDQNTPIKEMYSKTLPMVGDVEYTLKISRMVLHATKLRTMKGTQMGDNLSRLAKQTILKIMYDSARDPMNLAA